jgi:hypothetical protein
LGGTFRSRVEHWIPRDYLCRCFPSIIRSSLSPKQTVEADEKDGIVSAISEFRRDATRYFERLRKGGSG